MDRVKELIELAKLNKQLREKNINQEWSQAGFQRSISEFHKPVTEELKAHEENRKETMKAITTAINELPLNDSLVSTPLALKEIEKPPKKSYNIDPDVDLDNNLLREFELPLPSELFNNPARIEVILKEAKQISQHLGGLKSKLSRGGHVPYSKEELNYKIKMIRLYKEKIKALNVTKLFKITGEGLISELEVLTNKLVRGSKNKKIYNQVVSILDALLKDGEISNTEVQDYYKKFLDI